MHLCRPVHLRPLVLSTSQLLPTWQLLPRPPVLPRALVLPRPPVFPRRRTLRRRASRLRRSERGVVLGASRVGHLVDDAFEEPLADLAFDDDSVDRAVSERHVPFVAVPGTARGAVVPPFT
jgi:hypothetical protein